LPYNGLLSILTEKSIEERIMKVFIVHAHPEPKSFNGALTRRAVETLTADGHEVVVSDLYAMGFNPTSGRWNFTTVADPDYYKQQIEEAYATDRDGFAPDVLAEIRKLEWCDVLIFQFPLWWFGAPAILKGWVDRVFAYKRVYGRGFWYGQGAFRQKRALVSVTTGGPGTAYGPDGLQGDMARLLFPIQHGMLAFTGFRVLPPALFYAVAHLADADRAAMLDHWSERLRSLQTAEPLVWTPLLEDVDSALRDTMPRFLAHLTAPDAFPDGIAAALSRLQAQGAAQSAQVSEDGRQVWITLRAADSNGVRRSLEELPQSGGLEIRITPLAGFSAA
jgi:NAD(P)H dehydrogenase (quinone)